MGVPTRLCHSTNDELFKIFNPQFNAFQIANSGPLIMRINPILIAIPSEYSQI